MAETGAPLPSVEENQPLPSIGGGQKEPSVENDQPVRSLLRSVVVRKSYDLAEGAYKGTRAKRRASDEALAASTAATLTPQPVQSPLAAPQASAAGPASSPPIVREQSVSRAEQTQIDQAIAESAAEAGAPLPSVEDSQPFPSIGGDQQELSVEESQPLPSIENDQQEPSVEESQPSTSTGGDQKEPSVENSQPLPSFEDDQQEPSAEDSQPLTSTEDNQQEPSAEDDQSEESDSGDTELDFRHTVPDHQNQRKRPRPILTSTNSPLLGNFRMSLPKYKRACFAAETKHTVEEAQNDITKVTQQQFKDFCRRRKGTLISKGSKIEILERIVEWIDGEPVNGVYIQPNPEQLETAVQGIPVPAVQAISAPAAQAIAAPAAPGILNPATQGLPAPATQATPAPDTQATPAPDTQAISAPAAQEIPAPAARKTPAPATQEKPAPAVQDTPAPVTQSSRKRKAPAQQENPLEAASASTSKPAPSKRARPNSPTRASASSSTPTKRRPAAAKASKPPATRVLTEEKQNKQDEIEIAKYIKYLEEEDKKDKYTEEWGIGNYTNPDSPEVEERQRKKALGAIENALRKDGESREFEVDPPEEYLERMRKKLVAPVDPLGYVCSETSMEAIAPKRMQLGTEEYDRPPTKYELFLIDHQNEMNRRAGGNSTDFTPAEVAAFIAEFRKLPNMPSRYSKDVGGTVTRSVKDCVDFYHLYKSRHRAQKRLEQRCKEICVEHQWEGEKLLDLEKEARMWLLRIRKALDEEASPKIRDALKKMKQESEEKVSYEEEQKLKAQIKAKALLKLGVPKHMHTKVTIKTVKWKDLQEEFDDRGPEHFDIDEKGKLHQKVQTKEEREHRQKIHDIAHERHRNPAAVPSRRIWKSTAKALNDEVNDEDEDYEP